MSPALNNIHFTADVAENAEIADSAQVWHYAQIREGAKISYDCVVGRGAYIGAGVTLGVGCKVQNYALIYEPAFLEDGVFIGPAAVLTNDEFPRAINADGSPKSAQDWKPVGVHIKRGASVGANVVCIAPVVIGEWALVGSGSVVTNDVPNFALVVGNPARRVRWVGKAGVPLQPTNELGLYVCPVSEDLYRELSPDELIEVTEK